MAVAYILLFITIGSTISAIGTTIFLFVVLLTYALEGLKYYFLSSFLLSIAFMLEPITAIVLSGGIASPYIIWLIVPIYAASALLGNAGTIISSCMAIVFFIGIYFFQTDIQGINELNPAYYDAVYLLSFISGAALMGIFAFRNIFKIEKESFTQQKLRIAAEAANQKLVRNEKEQGKLLSIVSHELRTPAATLNMLLDSSAPLNMPLIKDTMSHLMDVLEDMRMVKEPELILKTPEQSADISVVIQRAIALVSNLTAEKKLNIRVHQESSLTELCLVREKLVRQIAMNIIKNCINHANATQLDIFIKATDLNDRMAFTITFTDNGQGVPLAKIPSLFDPFVKGIQKSSGSGLGLHLSKIFAQKGLQGDLKYINNEGAGATFQLEMLVQKVPKITKVNPQKKQPLADLRLDGLRILLAEDNMVIALMTKKLLEDKGATVFSAKDGELAFQNFQKQQIDLVLTDIFMPNVNGFQLTKKLRATGFTGKIIGCSAAVIGNEVDQLLQAGANKVFMKPLQLQDFLEYVNDTVIGAKKKQVIQLNTHKKSSQEEIS